jgi:flagellar basal-body rod protein FlgB
MDTPNYKAFDLIVEEEFQKISGTEKNIEPAKTQPMHFPFRETRLDNIKFKAVEPSQFTKRADGNTVDMDKSMAKLSKNTLMYNASAQIIAKKFQGLKDAIEGGGS